MRAPIEIYLLELKRFLLNRKTIALFLLVSLLSLYFVQIGTGHYKSLIENKDKFLDIERQKVKQYKTYTQYGTYGIRILFISSPLSIYFFNSTTIPELTANVDSGERLNIYDSFKGKTLFAEKSGGFKDFSGILLLLGSFLALFFGYGAMIHKDYLRFMTGFIDDKRLFLSIVLSRMAVILLFLLFNTGISLFLLKIDGITLLKHDYVHLYHYLVVLGLMLVFFFVLGTLIGSMKSRFTGFVMVLISWFVFVFFIPGAVSAIISSKADNIVSDYHLELEKLKKIMDFEKRAQDQVGPSISWRTNAKATQEFMEQFWRHDFKELQAFEKKLENEMVENIRHFQTLSLLFPSTFYLSTGDEISSKGYENFILFFNYIQELKEKFVRFYLDKKYHDNLTDSGDSQTNPTIVSFIKNHENLFYAESCLPKSFFMGLVLTLVYVVVLLVISYLRFGKSLRL